MVATDVTAEATAKADCVNGVKGLLVPLLPLLPLLAAESRPEAAKMLLKLGERLLVTGPGGDRRFEGENELPVLIRPLDSK